MALASTVKGIVPSGLSDWFVKFKYSRSAPFYKSQVWENKGVPGFCCNGQLPQDEWQLYTLVDSRRMGIDRWSLAHSISKIMQQDDRAN